MTLSGLDPLATRIPRVDFVAFARAQGADGVRVDDERALPAALEQALAREGSVRGRRASWTRARSRPPSPAAWPRSRRSTESHDARESRSAPVSWASPSTSPSGTCRTSSGSRSHGDLVATWRSTRCPRVFKAPRGGRLPLRRVHGALPGRPLPRRTGPPLAAHGREPRLAGGEGGAEAVRGDSAATSSDIELVPGGRDPARQLRGGRRRLPRQGPASCAVSAVDLESACSQATMAFQMACSLVESGPLPGTSWWSARARTRASPGKTIPWAGPAATAPPRCGSAASPPGPGYLTGHTISTWETNRAITFHPVVEEGDSPSPRCACAPTCAPRPSCATPRSPSCAPAWARP